MTVAGGTIKVKDEIRVEFEIVGRLPNPRFATRKAQLRQWILHSINYRVPFRNYGC